jgi:glutamate transport system substrate-binding protein
MKRLPHAIAAGLCAVSLCIGAGGCGTSISVVTRGVAQGPTITIGVASDQPGLGYLHGDEYSGFDITVAKYVAKALGFAEKQIVFKKVLPSTRVSSLADNVVDMVVDSFATDDAADGEVSFSGPYLNVGETLLVRADSVGTITGVDALSGKTVCAAKGSAIADHVRDLSETANVEERDSYPQCVTALMMGQADAVAVDDAVASGLASGRGSEYLNVVGKAFARRSYTVAVKSGQDSLTKQIDAALESMVSDGSWERAVEDMVQQIGYVPDSALNPPSMADED